MYLRKYFNDILSNDNAKLLYIRDNCEWRKNK